MARDVTLMMQTEVAEAYEPSGPGRGGSSTMPHKRNPVGSVLALAAAHRVPSLVASFLTAMVQEHERSAGGWQSEWPTIASIIQATGAATTSMAEVAGGLSVDEKQMQKNIDDTHGLIFAERAMLLLSPALGRGVAHKMVEEASRKCAVEGKSLADVLRQMPDITGVLDAETLANLDDPRAYLGVAKQFQLRLLRKDAK
jgi:3-carboxy-cis,cis-muconate cycloisomerase